MTADEPTPADGHDSIDTDDHDDRHLLGDELPAGHVSGEAFFSPTEAAVEIVATGDNHLAVRLREGTNDRGLTTTWMLTPSDARAVADRLATLAAEVEDD